MLKSIRAIMVLFTIIMTLAVTNVYAAPTIEVSFDGKKFTVTGQTEVKQSSQLVTIQVINPGESIENRTGSIEDIIFYTGSVKTDNAGYYKFEFGITNGISGTYTLMVSDKYSSMPAIAEYYCINTIELQRIINRINSSVVWTDLQSVFQGKNVFTMLGINGDDFDGVQNKQFVFQKLLEAKNSAPFSDTDTTLLAKTFHSFIALQLINESTSGAYVKTVMTKYNTELGYVAAGSDLEDSFTDLFDTAIQDEVYSRMYGKQLQTLADLKSLFETNVILSGVEKLRWQDLQKLLTDNSEILPGIDLNGYSSLDNKSWVLTEVKKLTYDSIADLVEGFNQLVEEAEDKPTDTGDRDSGSSSGGSKSGGSKTSFDFGGIQVSQIPQEQNSSKTAFSDLSNVSWAKDAIEELAIKGIIAGKAKGVFAPDDLIKREEFLKILVSAINKYDTTAVADFKDVSNSDWSNHYIGSAQKVGLINGEGDGQFGYGKPITRQDMTVMLFKAVTIAGLDVQKNSTIQFADKETISEYAKEAIGTLSGLKVVNGMQDNNFAPKENLTRAQAAKAIHNLLTVLNNK